MEIYRLPGRPDKPYGASAEIPGKKIEVNHVSVGMNALNFEPSEPVRRGVYWVRISGGGLHEGYLVELF